ncbi:sugar phosphate isomerase/epimerase family protein [Burkholderia sp. Ac-20379]|uniref:sugar phosphate isomerase/epimerase family protein n=1 Tax=Burkholderia sp. Ac-20379 TaxID=2703900 RepID=UPI00197D126F|nr:TIM barrel protein [Burkholderia sp. Ac-20379]MBN3725895.1 sugar phosphate isomerase/epimerase [Burkholderia sp. Ac-20379]
MKRLSLSHLTVLEVGPPNLIVLAAQAGFRAVGIRLCAPMPGGVEYPLRAGTEALRETQRRMAALNVAVSDIEVVRIGADTRVDDYLPAFEAGAELGARRVCVNIDDPDRGRAVDRLAALCDLARPHGLALDVEFMIWRPVARLEDAVDVVRRAGRDNAFVLIDALHLIRSGGTVEAVAALDPALIGSVQLCDAPLESPPASGIIDEARGNRLLPGDGELPLHALLAAVPEHVPLGAEVPLACPSDPAQRAWRVREATERLLHGDG